MASDHRVLADMLGTDLRILGDFEMTEPTLESRDEAAQKAGSSDWKSANQCGSPLAKASIRAHALTLDELHGRKDVSEAAEFWAVLADVVGNGFLADEIRDGRIHPVDIKAIALIEAKFAELRAPKEPEWIEWNGGECPVDAHTRVEVKFRSGNTDDEEVAGLWFWGSDDHSCDIIAYRVLS